MIERVFIVDEDIKARDFLYELISEIGCGVLTAPSGSSVLDILKNERPGLIILSDQAGDFSGFSLVEKIRSFDKDVKIIVLGDHVPAALAEDRARSSKISAYLSKNFEDPSTIRKLIAILNQDAPIKPQGSGKWGTILVVDDEPEGRETLVNYLKRRGFEAETASSGEECLEKVRQRLFGLVLLDITMAGMDGLLTLKRIKELRPGVRVVMTTALQNPEVVKQARAMGASDYLVKPFDFATLEAALISILLAGKKGASPESTKEGSS